MWAKRALNIISFDIKYYVIMQISNIIQIVVWWHAFDL